MTEIQQQRSSKLERLVEWYDRSEASKSRLAKPLLRVGVFIWFCWRELAGNVEGMAAELTYRTVFSYPGVSFRLVYSASLAASPRFRHSGVTTL